jgi:hypothetical protein
MTKKIKNNYRKYLKLYFISKTILKITTLPTYLITKCKRPVNVVRVSTIRNRMSRQTFVFSFKVDKIFLRKIFSMVIYIRPVLKFKPHLLTRGYLLSVLAARGILFRKKDWDINFPKGRGLHNFLRRRKASEFNWWRRKNYIFRK